LKRPKRGAMCSIHPLALKPGKRGHLPASDGTAMSFIVQRPFETANDVMIGPIKVFVFIRQLKSGILDHVPADLPDRVAPRLVEHYERVKNDPRIKAYHAKHGLPG
jgi:hypothetical protein